MATGKRSSEKKVQKEKLVEKRAVEYRLASCSVSFNSHTHLRLALFPQVILLLLFYLYIELAAVYVFEAQRDACGFHGLWEVCHLRREWNLFFCFAPLKEQVDYPTFY